MNESFAQRLLDGTSPLGSTFQLEGAKGVPDASFQIIGMVKDAKYSDLREGVKPVVFLPASQEPRPGTYQQYLIRSTGSLGDLMAAVRKVMQSNPDVTFHFHNFKQQIRESLMQERLMATLSIFFALLAVLLATVGLYGVMAYSVTQRRSEIGIRIALGADRRSILELIMSEAALTVGIGLIVGVVLAMVAGNTAERMLFGLTPRDTLTFVGAGLVLFVVGIIAGYIPARRAAALDPMSALREE